MKDTFSKASAFKPSAERRFEILHSSLLVLAILGAALFCWSQVSRLNQRTEVVAAPVDPQLETNRAIARSLEADIASLQEEKDALIRGVVEVQEQLGERTNALKALATREHQATNERVLAAAELELLKAALEKKQRENDVEVARKERDPVAREVEALNEQKRNLTASIEKLSADQRSTEAKRRRYDQEADQARRTRDQAKRELERLNQQKRDAVNELNRLKAEARTAEESSRRAKADSDRAGDRQRRARAELATLEKRKKELTTSIEKLRVERDVVAGQSGAPAAALSTAGNVPPKPSHGLRATYFRSRNLTGKSVERVDPVIDFDWKGGGPMSEVGVDNFSSRWEGQIEAPTSGRFTFHAISNDGVRCWINGQKIIDQWNDQGATEHHGSIDLKAGERYDLKMEHYEANGTAVARLFWTGPDTPRAIVPSSRLYPMDARNVPSRQ